MHPLWQWWDKRNHIDIREGELPWPCLANYETQQGNVQHEYTHIAWDSGKKKKEEEEEVTSLPNVFYHQELKRHVKKTLEPREDHHEGKSWITTKKCEDGGVVMKALSLDYRMLCNPRSIIHYCKIYFPTVCKRQANS